MTDRDPDVSFLIAAYNAEATIARAIDSALAQRGVSVEIIVVDDRSLDRTAEIARSMSATNVQVISLARNGGPAAARNAGLGVARGRWVAILDADDTVLPERLATMIRRGEAADADIVVDNLEVAKEGASRQEAMFEPSFLARIGEIRLADFIASNVLFEATFSYGYMKPIFRRQFLADRGLRYDETLRIGEDYVFMASGMAEGARCAVEPTAGYIYHVRDGSISRVLERHHVEAMLSADRTFLREHALDNSARLAQARRTRSLERAAAFLSLVDHLKARAPLKALAAALRDPAALWHLRMPIAVRLRRLVPQLGTSG